MPVEKPGNVKKRIKSPTLFHSYKKKKKKYWIIQNDYLSLQSK
jgi:hypothetical protein